MRAMTIRRLTYVYGQYRIPLKAQKARALGLAPQGASHLRGPSQEVLREGKKMRREGKKKKEREKRKQAEKKEENEEKGKKGRGKKGEGEGCRGRQKEERMGHVN